MVGLGWILVSGKFFPMALYALHMHPPNEDTFAAEQREWGLAFYSLLFFLALSFSATITNALRLPLSLRMMFCRWSDLPVCVCVCVVVGAASCWPIPGEAVSERVLATVYSSSKMEILSLLLTLMHRLRFGVGLQTLHNSFLFVFQ